MRSDEADDCMIVVSGLSACALESMIADTAKPLEYHWMIRIPLSAMVALAVLAGCQNAPVTWDEAKECPDLAQLDPAKAAADARTALHRSDKSLLGVYGVATEVPGGRRQDLPVRMIEGTSDYECLELNIRTRDYARRYNETIRNSIQGGPVSGS